MSSPPEPPADGPRSGRSWRSWRWWRSWPAWRVTAVVVLAALVVAALVAGLVELTRRGPDTRPELAQPLAAPAPLDPVARRAWAERLGAATGVPARALQAYGGATARTVAVDPGCGLSWVTLAGIGRVESNHARFAGAVLGDDGRPAPGSEPIRGPQLDGTGGNRVVTDTDGGRLDGDTRFDRAAGPLQFIPRTWALVGVDGDGDGRADPDDLDDAALAAARYLCHGPDGEADRDVRRGDDWRAAVLAYNRSGAYVARVHAEATGYARAARAVPAP